MLLRKFLVLTIYWKIARSTLINRIVIHKNATILLRCDEKSDHIITFNASTGCCANNPEIALNNITDCNYNHSQTDLLIEACENKYSCLFLPDFTSCDKTEFRSTEIHIGCELKINIVVIFLTVLTIIIFILALSVLWKKFRPSKFSQFSIKQDPNQIDQDELDQDELDQDQLDKDKLEFNEVILETNNLGVDDTGIETDVSLLPSLKNSEQKEKRSNNEMNDDIMPERQEHTEEHINEEHDFEGDAEENVDVVQMEDPNKIIKEIKEKFKEKNE